MYRRDRGVHTRADRTGTDQAEQLRVCETSHRRYFVSAAAEFLPAVKKA
jgi:hypothetical protein